jgi:hypothetical protein
MKFATVNALLAIATAAFSVNASPLKSRQSDSNVTGMSLNYNFGLSSSNAVYFSDADVLNYALTLEHISVAFYHQGLASFTDDSFKQAGFPDWVRPRLK